MTQLTAEQIEENWNKFINYINTFISEPRKSKLKDFYYEFQDRIILMPASHKVEYHNAKPAGYIDHVNRVIECALKLNVTWDEMGMLPNTFTTEELVFSALNHDLGKIGDEQHESFITQDDQWRRDKLKEDYKFNDNLAFASVPDRGLFLLQSNGIQYTFNEMVAIQTHDGLYDEGNKKYLMGFMAEQKPRTSLPFILHQADLMAARIEWENDWLKPFLNAKSTPKTASQRFTLDVKTPKKSTVKTDALKSIKSEGLKNAFNSL
jgi:hypothetical protein